MLNQNKVGLALGGLLALFHAVWAILVAMGQAGPLMDFIFKLHMMQNPFVMNPFNFGLALGLVVLTGVIGYVVGWVFAWVYNQVHK